MHRSRGHKASSLFLLRLWPEEETDGHIKWCGRVQHIASGEAHLFRDLTTLNAVLAEMLPDLETGKHPLDREDRT